MGAAVVEEGGDAVLHRAAQVEAGHARPAPVQGREHGPAVGPEAHQVEVARAFPVAAGPRPQPQSAQLEAQTGGDRPVLVVPRRQVHPLPQAHLAPGVPGLFPGFGADGLAVHGQPPGAEGTQAHVAGPLAGVSVEGGRPRGAQGKRGRRLPHGAGDPHGPAAVLARPAPGEAGRGAAVAGAEAEPVVPVLLPALGAAQEPEAEMGHGGEHPPLGGAVPAVAGGPGRGRLRRFEAGEDGGIEVAQHPRRRHARRRRGQLAARGVGGELAGGGRGSEQQQQGPGQGRAPHADSWELAQVARSPAQDHGLVADEGDDAGGQHRQLAALEDQVHVVAQLLLQLQGIGDRLLLRAVGAGAQDRLPQFLHQGGRHRVVGDADAHRLLAAAQQAGGLLGGRQHEGVGPGQQSPQGPVGVVGDARVAGDVVEVGADEGHRLAGVAALDAPDALHGALVGDVAAEAVDRVGGIDDDAAAAQDFHGAAQVPALEVLGIDGQHVGHGQTPRLGPAGEWGRRAGPDEYSGSSESGSSPAGLGASGSERAKAPRRGAGGPCHSRR